MAYRIRYPAWKEDLKLKHDLKQYVRQSLSRREILDFVSREYAQYAWSLGTLSRRLAFYDIELEDVEAAVRAETRGPGQLLGYRAMQDMTC